MSGNRGFALLLTLWLLVPVSLLLLQLTGAARADGQIATNHRHAAMLEAAADGGIETAILSLLTSRSAGPSRVTLGNASVALSVVSLSGLVNPNLVAPALLQALIEGTGEPPAQAAALAAAIVEWRSPGTRGRDGQDKAAAYQTAGLGYRPPGAPFETIGELRDVIGMKAAVLAAIRPALSLFADRPPDPALAPAQVRAALARLGTAAAGTGQPGTVFRIVATAIDGTGGSVARSAVIRLAVGSGGRPWTVLAWGGSDLAGQ